MIPNRKAIEYLSEHAYCALPATYFDSPGRVDLLFERRNEANPDQSAIHTVILSEPEPTIRAHVGDRLRSHGFRVIECSDDEHVFDEIANEIVRRHPLEDQVLISDLSHDERPSTTAIKNIAESNILREVVAFARYAPKSMQRKLDAAGVRYVPASVSSSRLLSYLESLS